MNKKGYFYSHENMYKLYKLKNQINKFPTIIKRRVFFQIFLHPSF